MRTIKLKKCKRVSHLRFSPDGRRLVAVGGPQAFMVEAAVTLDVATGEEVGRVEKLGTCGVTTPDAKRYVVGGSHEYDVGSSVDWVPLSDVRNWHALGDPPGSYVTVHGLAVDPTGRTLAVGYEREDTRWSVSVGPFGRPWQFLKAHAPPVVIAFNHAGTRLAVTGGPEGEPRVDVFELPSGKQRLAFAPPGTRTTALLYHPDGRLFVANSRTVHVHAPDHHYGEVQLTGHKGQVNGLALSPDGKRLLSASHDGAVRVWDAVGGELVRAFDWKVGPLTAIAFAPDGLTCAAAGKNGQLVLWDADG